MLLLSHDESPSFLQMALKMLTFPNWSCVAALKPRSVMVDVLLLPPFSTAFARRISVEKPGS